MTEKPAKRIDFGGRNWTAKPQEDWLEWAGNPNFPDYLRVTFVAHGRQRPNGHAPLEREELARYLVRKSGAIPDRRTVYRAVDTAVKFGYLSAESRALCLVLDASRSQIRLAGMSPDEKCRRVHSRGRKNTGVKVVRDVGRFANDGGECRLSGANDGTETGPFGTNDGNERRPFTLAPSLSSQTAPPGAEPPGEAIA